MKNQRRHASQGLVCLAMSSLLFAACSTKPDQQTSIDSTASVIATITEIQETNLLVEPIEGSEELNSSDVFSVSQVNIEMPADIQVGDQVEIFYNGQIQETAPAILDGVERIESVK